jgi:WD40 repeat protein
MGVPYLRRASKWTSLSLLLGACLLGIAPGQEKSVSPAKEDAKADGKNIANPSLPGLVAVLRGHVEPVYALAFSPDGRFLVTGSFDNTLKLWDVASQKELRTFGGPEGHTKLVLAVAFRADGRQVASGGADNTAKVWDVPSSQPLRTLAAGAPLRHLALSPDGKRVAAAGQDGIIRLWDVADGKLLSEGKGHQGPATQVAFSPNGQFLISGGQDQRLRFWNATTGQFLAELGAHAGAVMGLAVHPGNNQVFSAGADGWLRSWPLPPPTPRALPPAAAGITALSLSADGNQVLSASGDQPIRLIQVANGGIVRQLPRASAPLAAVAAGGAWAAAGGREGQLFLWNLSEGKLLTQIPAHEGGVTGVAFRAAGPQLVSSGADGRLKLWAVPLKPARTLPHPDAVLALALRPDGKLYTGGADKLLRAWDLNKLQLERQFSGAGNALTTLAVSANGQVLVSGDTEGMLHFWNPANGQPSQVLGGHTGAVTSLVLAADGQHLLSTGSDGAVKLWTLPVTPPRAFAHADQVTSLALTADGQRLITGGADKQVRWWDLKTGQSGPVFSGPTLAVSSLALSLDGRFLAAGSADKNIYLWPSNDSKGLRKISCAAPVQAVAFSPEGKTLAAGLTDGAVLLVEPATGKVRQSLPAGAGPVAALAWAGKTLLVAQGNKVQTWGEDLKPGPQAFPCTAPVRCLAVTRDGQRLIAGSDKEVQVWNLSTGQEMARWSTPAAVLSVACSPDGQQVLVGGADARARLYEVHGALREFFPHDGPVHAVLFHPDGQRVLTGAADKLARLWRPALVWQRRLTGPARRARFSPKGDLILAIGDEPQVHLWRRAAGQEVGQWPAHTGPLLDLVLSQQGQVLTAGNDKTVKLWQPDWAAWSAQTSAGPLKLPPPATFSLPAAPEALALSSDGRRLALSLPADKGSMIQIWDSKSGQLLLRLTTPGAVRALAFTDERTLLAAGMDRVVHLFDVGVLASWEAHSGGVTAFSLNNPGTQAVTAGADKTVKLWDLAAQRPLKNWGPLPGPVQALAVTTDFTLLAAAAGTTIQVWNLNSGQEVLTRTTATSVTALALSPDKNKLAAGTVDHLLHLWEIPTGQELVFYATADTVSALAFLPDSKQVLAGTADKQLLVFPVPPGRGWFLGKEPLRFLTLTPEGAQALVGQGSAVKLVNLSNGQVERTFTGPAPAAAAALSRNRQLLALAWEDKSLHLWSLAEGQELKKELLPAVVHQLSFSANNQLLLGAAADGSLRAWSVPYVPNQPLPAGFLEPVQVFAHRGPATGLALSAEGTTVYSSSLDQTVQVWQLAAPTPVRNFPHPNLVSAVAFHPQLPQLATGCADGKIRIYDVAKGALLREIAAHPTKEATQIYTIAYSPDGKWLASAGYDHSIRLWDAASGASLRTFPPYDAKTFPQGHAAPVLCLAFSPDGKLLASGSGDQERRIKLWSLADGKLLRDLVNPQLAGKDKEPAPAHPGWVYGLSFYPDGKRLLSAGNAPANQGYLALWDVATGQLLFGATYPAGAFYALALSPDGQWLALGAGPRGPLRSDLNCAYLLRSAALAK